MTIAETAGSTRRFHVGPDAGTEAGEERQRLRASRYPLMK